MATFALEPSGSFHQTVQAIVTVLAVINPVVCGSIFLMLTQQLDPDKRWRAAINVALSILAILVVSALIGLKVLSTFGISLEGHLEKLISMPIADLASVNICESEREQSRIIRRQFCGERPVGAIFRGALKSFG
jgi:hypothetical protein